MLSYSQYRRLKRSLMNEYNGYNNGVVIYRSGYHVRVDEPVKMEKLRGQYLFDSRKYV